MRPADHVHLSRPARLALLALATALPALQALPAAAAVGTTPDTRPAAPQQRKQWQNFGVGTELSGFYLQGNADIVNLGATVNFNANFGPHQFFVDGGNTLNRVAGKTLVNRLAGSGLYAYALLDNFNAFGYTTLAHGLSTRVDYRLTNGAGLCLHRIAEPVFKLFLISVAPAYEQEWIRDGVDQSAGPRYQTAWRGVARANAVLPLSDTLDWGVDTFYTPAVPDFADYRVYAESYLQVRLTPVFSLKMSVADEYDSRPEQGIWNNDAGVFLGLKADFGR